MIATTSLRAPRRPTPTDSSEAATDIHPEQNRDQTWDQLGQLLEVSALSPTPSEAQGILCGLICGGEPDPERVWLNQLLQTPQGDPEQDQAQVLEVGSGSGPTADPRFAAARDGLHALAQRTLDEIQGTDIGFTLLLPADDRPLVERATALYDWIRGFLFALGVLGVSAPDLSAQGREVLSDFATLTRMDLDALSEGEEDETALAELIEFVWVAAMLIHDERGLPRQEAR